MPLYSIQGPDGNTYQIEGPEGATKEQIVQAVLYKLSHPEPQPKTAPSSLKDIAASFARGAVGSTKSLTDLFGADNSASETLDSANQALAASMTPARRAELQRQAERSKRAAASGSTWEEVKAGFQNVAEAPLQAAAEGLGSFVPYLPALLLGPVAPALGLSARAVAAADAVVKYAPRVIATGQGVGAVKGSIYEAVYEAERAEGASEEAAREKASKAQAYVGQNLDQIALGGGLGYLSGSSGIERLLTKEGVKKAAPSMLRRVGRSLIEEVPTEAGQGGQEALAANLALQRSGRDVPTWQGVAGQATQEGLMGALAAGPVAALRSPAGQREEEDRARKAAEYQQQLAEEQKRLAEQQQHRQTPEYLDDIERRYAALREQERALYEAKNAKPEAGDLAGQRAKEQAAQAYTDLRRSDEYQSTLDEYLQARPRLRARKAEADAAAARQAQVDDFVNTPQAQGELFGGTQAPNDQSPQAQFNRIDDYINALTKNETAARKKGDERTANALAQQIAQLRASQGTDPQAQAQLAQAQQEMQRGIAKELKAAELAPLRDELAAAEQAATPLTKDDIDRSLEKIESLLNTIRKRNEELVKSGADTQRLIESSAPLAQLQTVKEQLQQQRKTAPVAEAAVDEDALAALQKKVENAVTRGEDPMPFLRKMQEAQRQRTLQGEIGRQVIDEKKLAEEMAAGREQAAQITQQEQARQNKVRQEAEALRRIGKQATISDEYVDLVRTAMGLGNAFVEPAAPGTRERLSLDNAEVRQARKRIAELRQTNPSAINDALALVRQEYVQRNRQQLQTLEAARERVANLTNQLQELSAVALGRTRSFLTAEDARANIPRVKAELEQARAFLDARTPQPQQAKDNASLLPRQRAAQRESDGNKPLVTGSPVSVTDSDLQEAADQRVEANLKSSLGKSLDDAVADAVTAPQEKFDAMNSRQSLLQRLKEMEGAKHDRLLDLEDELRNQNFLAAERLKNRLLALAVGEANLRQQLDNEPELTPEEAAQLRAEVKLILDDFGRVAIKRNEDNSYAYGVVSGYIDGIERKEGSLSAEKAQAFQNELQDMRQMRMGLESRIAALKDNPGRKIDIEYLQASLARADARVNELTAILGAYIRGENLQSVVVPATVRGSNAPLSMRALGVGNRGAMFEAIQEQLDTTIDRFSPWQQEKPEEFNQRWKELTGRSRPSGPTYRGVALVKGERLPALDGFTLLERIRAGSEEIAALNAQLKKSGNPKQQEKKDARDNLVAMRDQAVRRAQAMRALYNRIRVKDTSDTNADAKARERAQKAVEGRTAVDPRSYDMSTAVEDKDRPQGTMRQTLELERITAARSKQIRTLDERIAQLDAQIRDLQSVRSPDTDPRQQGLIEKFNRNANGRRLGVMQAQRIRLARQRDELTRGVEAQQRKLRDTYAAEREDTRDTQTQDMFGDQPEIQVPTDAEETAAKTQLVEAQTALEAARRDLASEEKGYENDVAQAERGVVASKTKLRAASLAVEKLTDEIAQLRKQAAEDTLPERAKLKARAIEKKESDLQRANVALKRAQEDFDKAEVALETAQGARSGEYFKGRTPSTRVSNAQAEVNRLRARLEDIQRRRREGAQQEAARAGKDLGEMQADKLARGDTRGFVGGTGKALRSSPKNAASWAFGKTAGTAKPNVLIASMQKLRALRTRVDAAQARLNASNLELLAAGKKANQVTERMLKNAEEVRKTFAEISEATEQIVESLNRNFIPNRDAILKEIEELTKQGFVSKSAELREKVDGAFGSIEKMRDIAGDVVHAEIEARAALDRAKAAAETAYSKYLAGRKATDDLSPSAPYVAFQAQQDKMARADKAYGEALNKIEGASKAYGQARLDRLVLEQAVASRMNDQVAENSGVLIELGSRLSEQSKSTASIQKTLQEARERNEQARRQLEKEKAARDALQAKVEEANARARNAERIAEEDAARAASDESRKEAERESRIQTGTITDKDGKLLFGTRVARDTAGENMTMVQNALKRELALAENARDKTLARVTLQQETRKRIVQVRKELESAQANGDDIVADRANNELEELSKKLVGSDVLARDQELLEKQEQAVRDARAQLDRVFEVAPKVTSDPNAKPEPVEQPAPVEGTRSKPRKAGPLVRNVSGANKRATQSGQVKLMASGMSQSDANAVSVYVLKTKAEKLGGKWKVRFAAITEGMSKGQVDTLVAEGKRLTGLGPTAELIAKRQALLAAIEARNKAEAAVKAAKTSLEKELAQDALEEAEQASERAHDQYNTARDLYDGSRLARAKGEAVEEQFEEDDDARIGTNSAVLDEQGDDVTRITADNPLDDDDGDTQPDMRSLYSPPRSSGKGSTVDKVKRLADRFVEGWAKLPNIVVVQSMSELPPDILRQADRDQVKNIPGVYHVRSKTVYLVADNLSTPGDVISTVLHEVSGHFGLREMLGNRYDATMRSIYEGNAGIRAQADAKRAANPNLLLNDAIEEALAEIAEQSPRAQQKALNALRRIMYAIKQFIQRIAGITHMSDSEVIQIVANARRYVRTGKGGNPGGGGGSSESRFKSASFVGTEPRPMENFKANMLGLAGRVQYIDRLAAADKGFLAGVTNNKLENWEAFQAQYYMRMGDQVSQAAGQFITNGPVRIVREKLRTHTEERYEAKAGANLVNVANYIERAAKAAGMTPEDAERMLTVRIAGERANATPRGWERLFADDPVQARAEYNADAARISSNIELRQNMDAAMAEYKAYNDGLLDFLVQTSALSAAEAKRLKKTPYVPYYRVEKDGTVRLYTDREGYVRIGNIKDQPDLKQMVGDNRQIMPILTSAVQNTFMLSRMGLHNKSTMETVKALEKVGFVSRMGSGPGIANESTVHYKINGEDYFATIDADAFGVPAHLIVKGMEGIKTAIPTLVRALGIPANWVRKFVTRSPVYVLRQLVRDPLNAAITQGTSGAPVLNALKQLAKIKSSAGNETEQKLMAGLAISSNVYTGDEQDMTKFMRDLMAGRGTLKKTLSWLDTMAIQADAATRAVIYEDSIKKGLTRAQAEFRALESQNFSRRGLSPSMQMLSVLIPFFNAQVQGLDVLWRAFKGELPFGKQLELRKKMLQRGVMLAATAMAYALLMQDDERYRKARPEERYQNFFIPVPGMDDLVRVPIPYEIGILFKAIPEAVLDAALTDTKAKDAAIALGRLVWNSAPGLAPAAVKPVVEAALGQTAFGPIETRREKGLPAEQRYRENTPEVLKMLGAVTGEVGVSPIMLEHFTRSYTATLGVAALRMFDPVLRGADDGEKTPEGPARAPLIGGVFQTADGRHLIDRAYERMEEIEKAVQGYKDLAERGRRAEAAEFAQRHADLLAAKDMAGAFRQSMGKKYTDERMIRQDPRMSAEQKETLIKLIKNAQNAEARLFYQAADRTTRQ